MHPESAYLWKNGHKTKLLFETPYDSLNNQSIVSAIKEKKETNIPWKRPNRIMQVENHDQGKLNGREKIL